MAMAEAMEAGTATVVPNVGDLGELVHNRETDWLVNPAHVSGCADRICVLLEDAELWSRVSAAARRAARDFNEVSSVARRWEPLISREAISPNAEDAGT
jgi:glycosyltransferase involved in cell wall biosynthesis